MMSKARKRFVSLVISSNLVLFSKLLSISFEFSELEALSMNLMTDGRSASSIRPYLSNRSSMIAFVVEF